MKLQEQIEFLRDGYEIGFSDTGCLNEIANTMERLTEKLYRIEQWCKAYPRTVFIEPTKEMWAEANRVLDAAEGCPSLTAISGSNMRHVVEGIKAIAAADKEKGQ